MTDRKKVGAVVIMHPNHNNYGTSLQGFATIKLIELLGHDYEIIRYVKKRSIFEIMRILPMYLMSGGFYNMKRRIKKKILTGYTAQYAKDNAIRTATLNSFKERYFKPRSHFYEGYADLQKGSRNYDVIFVGSDQVWTPASLYSKFYNLLFVDDAVRKFSYASSFGVAQIPARQHEKTAHYLNRLDAIGVREISGKHIVESLTSKQATVVLDPTLLLSKEKWQSFVDAPKKYDEPYIFCYILGSNETTCNAVNELKKATGLKVVYLRHVDEYRRADDSMGDYAPFDVSPLDFVNLIRHASYVLTDSFHGSIFSIIFNKQFTTFYRYIQDSNSITNKNSRIDSLFDIFGLKNRIFRKDIVTEINRPIDFASVNTILERERDKSLAFLKENLEK